MKKPEYKWVMLALVSSAYFLAQGTRNVYGAVLPSIGLDLGLSNAARGAVATAFFATFGLMIPLAGFLADFFSRKRMVVLGMALFSSAVLATGFAASFGVLLLAYGVVNAAGQSLMPPSNSSLIGQFHVETRSRAFSVYQTTFYVGIVVCCCVGGLLAGLGAGGWRWAFRLFGALGLVWAGVLAKFLRDTPQPAASARPSVSEAFKAFFGKPTALLLMLALGFYFFATNGFKTWSVTFMEKTMGLDHGAASFNGTFWFYLGAIAGVMLAGIVADKLRKMRPGARLETNVVGLALTIPFVLVAAFTGSLVLMCVAVFSLVKSLNTVPLMPEAQLRVSPSGACGEVEMGRRVCGLFDLLYQFTLPRVADPFGPRRSSPRKTSRSSTPSPPPRRRRWKRTSPGR